MPASRVSMASRSRRSQDSPIQYYIFCRHYLAVVQVITEKLLARVRERQKQRRELGVAGTENYVNTPVKPCNSGPQQTKNN